MIVPSLSPRRKDSPLPARPPARPTPPWLAGATIGLVLFGMASGAMALGAGWALTGLGKDPQDSGP